MAEQKVFTSTGQEISPQDPNFAIFAAQNNPPPKIEPKLPTVTETADIATPTTPTVPNLITSEPAVAAEFDTGKRIEEARVRSEERRTNLERRRAAEVSRIQETFKRRTAEREKIFEEQEKTQAAVSFKLGRAGTPFAADLARKQEEARQGVLDNLQFEKEGLISRAQNAFTDRDFQLVDALQNEIAAIEQTERDIEKEDRIQKQQDFTNLLALSQEARAEKGEARLQLQEERSITTFIQEQEDRVADALSAGLIDLDENNEIIRPTNEAINALAEQNRINPEILISEVNKRIDEVKKIARENRKEELENLKFDETQKQNEIRNEISRRSANIAAGNLALSQAKFAIEQAKAAVLQDDPIRAAITELPAGQQEGAFSAIASFKNADDILRLLDAGAETGPIKGRKLTGISLFGIPLSPSTQSFEKTEDGGIPFFRPSTKEEDELLAAMTAFSANFIKSISGVAVAKEEFERLMNALPNVNRQEDVNRNALKALLDTIVNKYETQLGISLDSLRNQDLGEQIEPKDDIDDFLNNIK